MKQFEKFIIVIVLIFVTACSDSKGIERTAPEFKSSTPKNNDSNVSIATDFEVVFDEVIKLAPNHNITINNAPANVSVSFTKLMFTVDLSYNTSYKINIPKGSIINTFDIPLNRDIELSFSTQEEPEVSTSMEFVANMGVGWNLGNTLDSKGNDETVWGNPRATQELINAISDKGFKTLRVPVTWQYHMGDAPNYTIEKDWLDRVEEVVNYGLSNDMYVIINIHHDEEWVVPSYAKLDKAKDQLGKVWTQIANRFKDYNNRLIFETLNETRLKGSPHEWSGGTAEGRDCINQFHKVSVDAIRNTGSENAERYIMVSTYAASASQQAMDGLVLPSSSNLIVSIHNYFPYDFALNENSTNINWGTDAEKQALDFELDKVYRNFISKGIAVVMGEWGNLNHNNKEDRIRHAAYYTNGCLKRGICPIWWDNGNPNEFGIINRKTYESIYPEIVNAMVNADKK
ncbi:MAG: cellulase family glycosylhydrolase [Bacteroidales bacterium]|nr:cellulase family glycosylhydrolase [Bacteroidales bacterium]